MMHGQRNIKHYKCLSNFVLTTLKMTTWIAAIPLCNKIAFTKPNCFSWSF